MRVLGVDFGFKRIGVAVGESAFGIVSTRPALNASGALKSDALAISRLARLEEVNAIALGLPVEESGEEGRMARIARALAGHLTDLGESVSLVNEIYSSLEAEQNLAQAGVKISAWKQLKDGEAARVILERYFELEASKST